MKKIVLSLILCFVLGFGVLGLSACKKDPGYSLSNLADDYKAIADERKSIVYDTADERLEFDYSVFENANGEQYLATALSNKRAPYYHLNDYNKILYNAMAFINNNIRSLSTDAYSVSKSLRNEAKAKIDNLSTAFERVDIQVQEFARNINTNSGRDNVDEFLTNALYLQTFKHLLDSYNVLYEAAFDTTITLSKIYYSITDDFQTTDMSTTKLSDLSEQQQAEFIDSFTKGLQNRTNLALAGYSYVFYKQNMQNGEMSTRLTTKQLFVFGSMGAAYNIYTDNVAKISKNIVAPSTTKAPELQQLSIELFNIWSTMSNDFEKFFKAYRSVDSNILKTDFNLTSFEQTCFEIMDNFYYLLEQNVQTLIRVYNYI